MSTDAKTYEGQCYCGAVKIVVTGDSAGVGYDHCKNCRSWSASPVNAFTLWPPEAVQVIEGEDQIGEFNMNEQTYRQWCKVCGVICWRVTRCGGRRLCGDYPFVSVYAPTARQLRVDRAAHEGRATKAQGLPHGAGRLGGDAIRVGRALVAAARLAELPAIREPLRDSNASPGREAGS
jgi:hypothetical protein